MLKNMPNKIKVGDFILHARYNGSYMSGIILEIIDRRTVIVWIENSKCHINNTFITWIQYNHDIYEALRKQHELKF